MSEFKESKGFLGKLLATENIQIEQRAVSTAKFNLKTRVLILPEFIEGCSENVTDLMISHETGHALYTPEQEWALSVENSLIDKDLYFDIQNIIEDIRIEKLIKQKYPGLKKVYYSGYRELYDRKFFGETSVTNPNSLNLIDRINLHFKVGFIFNLRFSLEESQFLNKLESIKTFSEVILLTEELIEFIKCKAEEKIKSIEGKDFEKESSIFDDGLKELDEEDEETDKLDEEELIDQIIEQEISSTTQNEFDRNIKDLYKDRDSRNLYLDVHIPETKKFVLDYKEILTLLKTFNCTALYYRDRGIKNYHIDIRLENNDIVNYLAKEFLLKKKAKERKKVKISKSGDISPNKLYQYKVSDNIFKRFSSIESGKSHGLIFFLDWSGSMTGYLKDTLLQLINLLLFCKKVKIPFEVYAFTSTFSKTLTSDQINNLDRTKNNIYFDYTLLNLFSSRMTDLSFNVIVDCLMTYIECSNMNKKGFWHSVVPSWLHLTGTPLNSAILCCPKLAEEFKQRTKIDIVNCIFLTDGESQGPKFITAAHPKSYVGSLIQEYYTLILREERSNQTIKLPKVPYGFGERSTYPYKVTKSLLQFTKKYTDYRIFGFGLIDRRDFRKNFDNFYETPSDKEIISKQFSENNFVECPNLGYDKFYFVRTNILDEEEEIFTLKPKENINSIYKKFSKSVGNKQNNRIFLKRFIEFIS